MGNYKLTYCEELTQRTKLTHKSSYRILAKLIDRNKKVNKPRKVRNPKVAAQVNAMHEKWLAAKAQAA